MPGVAEVDVIIEMARRDGLRVAEGASQTVYAVYKDRPLGAIGHLGVFSFPRDEGRLVQRRGRSRRQRRTVYQGCERLAQDRNRQVAFPEGGDPAVRLGRSGGSNYLLV